MNHIEHTDPRVYELGYHLVPTIAEEHIPEMSGAVRGMIEQISKEIISEELPVFIDLAYPIVKVVEHKNKYYTESYFGWIKFKGYPAGIAKLEEELKKNDNILRYLVTKTLHENTMIAKKFPESKMKRMGEGAPLASAPKLLEAIEVVDKEVFPAASAVSDAELDKAIEELVA